MMNEYWITRGRGRTKVELTAQQFGSDIIVTVCNAAAHIGAVAVGEFDHETQRTSVSLITRRGHKDDAIAQRAAYMVSKAFRKPVCVVAGVHLDDITPREIQTLVKNAAKAVESFLETAISP